MLLVATRIRRSTAFDYVAMLNAVIAVLDGAKYLWENTDEKQPHA